RLDELDDALQVLTHGTQPFLGLTVASVDRYPERCTTRPPRPGHTGQSRINTQVSQEGILTADGAFDRPQPRAKSLCVTHFATRDFAKNLGHQQMRVKPDGRFLMTVPVRTNEPGGPIPPGPRAS